MDSVPFAMSGLVCFYSVLFWFDLFCLVCLCVPSFVTVKQILVSHGICHREHAEI